MDNQRFIALTWLRGVAAFFVIINHVILAARDQYSAFDSLPFMQPLDILNLGMFAVYLFFALSGCTLTLNYFSKINNVKDFFLFYIKRFFRIWPAFAISMLIYLLFIEFFKLAYPLHKGAWIELFLKDYSLSNVFQYLSLGFNITGPRDLFNGPYWSLPVEFQYYLLLPLALLFMRNNVLNVCVPLFIGVAFYIIYSLKIVPMDRQELFKMGFAFFGGALLARVYMFCRIKVPIAISISVFSIVVLICGLIANHIILMPENLPIFNDANNFFGLCSLVVVGLALVTRPESVVTGLSRFLSYYGEISYSTYLFHMLFVGLTVILITDFNIHNYLIKLVFILLVTVLGSYFLSKFTYAFIEKPSIAWGGRLVSKKLNLNKSLSS